MRTAHPWISLALGLSVMAGLSYLSHRGYREADDANRQRRSEAFHQLVGRQRDALRARLALDEERLRTVAAAGSLDPSLTSTTLARWIPEGEVTSPPAAWIAYAAEEPEGSSVKIRAALPGQFAEMLLGAELAARPERAATLGRAAATGKPTASAVHPLADLGLRGDGFLLAVPVFAPAAEEAAAPRATGFAVSAHLVGEYLVDLAGSASLRPGFRVNAKDIGDGLVTPLLPEPPRDRATEVDFASAYDVQVGGRWWRLTWEAGPEFERDGVWTARTVLTLGLIVALAIGVLVFHLARHGGAARHMLHLQRRELDASRDEIERTLRALQGANDRLREANERLRAADQAKSDFLSVVSHELRTPLTVLQELFDLLLGGTAEAVPPAMVEYLNLARSQLQRVNRLLNDLLDYARLEANALPIQRRFVPPRDVLERVGRLFAATAAGRRQRLELSAGAGISVLWIDPDRLEQILDNLVANALKHTPDGGAVRLAVEEVGDVTIFTVADEGRGIALEEQARLFERFYQTETGRKSRHRGFGLGLSIAKGLTQLMSGAIDVASAPGVGTTFRISFPRPEPGVVLDEVRAEVAEVAVGAPVRAARAVLPRGSDADGLDNWIRSQALPDAPHRTVRIDGERPELVVVAACAGDLAEKLRVHCRPAFPQVAWSNLAEPPSRAQAA